MAGLQALALCLVLLVDLGWAHSKLKVLVPDDNVSPSASPKSGPASPRASPSPQASPRSPSPSPPLSPSPSEFCPSPRGSPKPSTDAAANMAAFKRAYHTEPRGVLATCVAQQTAAVFGNKDKRLTCIRLCLQHHYHLTEEEFEQLCDAEFTLLSKALREGPNAKQLQRKVRLAALVRRIKATQVPPIDIPLYRGLHVPPTGVLSFLDQHRVGASVSYDWFTSFTGTPPIAFDFMGHQTNKMFLLHAASSSSLTYLAGTKQPYLDEDEFLMLPGTVFRVTAVTPDLPVPPEYTPKADDDATPTPPPRGGYKYTRIDIEIVSVPEA